MEKTPETSGLKGDKLVGKYYVLFDKKYKEQIAELVASGDCRGKGRPGCGNNAGSSRNAAAMGSR
jgi:hypothetical protein